MKTRLPIFSLAAACGLMGMASSRAAVSTLTFEGLMDGEDVLDYYSGGYGGYGSGPGPDHGVIFSSNALALVDSDDSPSGNGNIGGEPSPSTVLFFLGGQSVTLTHAAGFGASLSFYYSSPYYGGEVSVYDGPYGTGSLLAFFEIPTTPDNGAPDPTGTYSPLLPVELQFQGTARSVQLGGAAGLIVFDDVVLGSPVSPIPEPGSVLALGCLLASGLVLRVRRSRPTA
jgi:hypothetical protein